MTNNKRSTQDFDPSLLDKINLLEQVPERDPESAAKTRKKFLTQVEHLPLTGSISTMGWLLGLFGLNSPEGAVLSVGKRKLALSTIAASLLVIVILFGGASATAYASQSALPGDALYPLKTSLEQTQINLANDAYYQAQLHLAFAQRRLNEIKGLLAQGRTSDVEFASNEFEHDIQEAMKASQIVQAADAERGAELNKLVSQALLDYASALKSVLVAAPDAIKPVVEKALLASQSGAGDEVEIFGIVGSLSETELEIEGVVYSITDLTEFEDYIQPGDMVKIHVIVTQDGAMIVREIERSGESHEDSDKSGDDSRKESTDKDETDDKSDDDHESGEDSNQKEADHDENNSESDENENDNESESGDHSDENDSNGSSNENDSDDEGSGSEPEKEDSEEDSNSDESESEEENESSNDSSVDSDESNEEEESEEEDKPEGGG